MDKVYHYTKIKSGDVNILENIIQKDNIHLHSTFFRKYFKEDYLWIKNFSKEIVKEICEEKGWQYDEDDLTIKPYLISFCIDADSSYMWTNYADNGKGMKLIFDKSFILNCGHSNPDKHGGYYPAIETALPCIYIENKDKLKSKLLENINNPILEPFVFIDRLKFLVASIKKTKPYEEEQEFRHIHIHSISFRTYSNNDDNFYYQDDEGPTDKDDMWIDILFPKEMLLGIELGSSATNEDMQYVHNHIKTVGYDPRFIKVTKRK